MKLSEPPPTPTLTYVNGARVGGGRGGYALAARAGQPFGCREGGGEGRGEKWLPTGPLLVRLPAGSSHEAVRPLARENVSGTVIAVLISVRAGQSGGPARRTTQVRCGTLLAPSGTGAVAVCVNDRAHCCTEHIHNFLSIRVGQSKLFVFVTIVVRTSNHHFDAHGVFYR